MRFDSLIIEMQSAKWIKLSHLFFLSLVPLCPLSPLSFSQDVPKDYRHVSLTGVKQRFEDEAYQHISKEQVLNLHFLSSFLSRKSYLILFLYNFLYCGIND